VKIWKDKKEEKQNSSLNVFQVVALDQICIWHKCQNSPWTTIWIFLKGFPGCSLCIGGVSLRLLKVGSNFLGPLPLTAFGACFWLLPSPSDLDLLRLAYPHYGPPSLNYYYE
jgi:hypothetical protein